MNHVKGEEETKKKRFGAGGETPQVNEIQSFVVREKSDGTDNDFLISSVSTAKSRQDGVDRMGDKITDTNQRVQRRSERSPLSGDGVFFHPIHKRVWEQNLKLGYRTHRQKKKKAAARVGFAV